MAAISIPKNRDYESVYCPTSCQNMGIYSHIPGHVTASEPIKLLNYQVANNKEKYCIIGADCTA